MIRERNKKIIKKIKIQAYVICFIIIIGSINLIFNDFGFKKLKNLKHQKNALNANIQQLLGQQISLQKEINKLKNDTSHIERIAREKFMMVKPGEKVFRFIESKSSQ